MPLDAEDKATITRLFLYVAVGSLIAGGVMLALLDRSVDRKLETIDGKIERLPAQIHVFNSGDTPIVLVGDSVKLQTHQSGSNQITWAPEPASTGYPANGYYAQGQGAIASISIRDTSWREYKNIPTGGKDFQIAINVESCGSLVPDAVDVQQVTVSARPMIHVVPHDPHKTFLPKTLSQPTELEYKHQFACPHGGAPDTTFSSVSVTVAGVQQDVPCTDATTTPPRKRCRVALTE